MAHLHHLALEFASFLKEVKVVDSTSCARPDHKDAMMVLSEDALGVISLLEESSGESASFLETVCKPAEVSVIYDRVVESGAVLVDHLELIVLGAGKEGSVMLVGVEHSFASGSTEFLVHGAVESHCCNVWTMRLSGELVDPSRCSQDLSAVGAKDEILGLDCAPQDTIRECQKGVFGIEAETEMCVASLVQALFVEGPVAES